MFLPVHSPLAQYSDCHFSKFTCSLSFCINSSKWIAALEPIVCLISQRKLIWKQKWIRVKRKFYAEGDRNCCDTSFPWRSQELVFIIPALNKCFPVSDNEMWAVGEIKLPYPSTTISISSVGVPFLCILTLTK